MKKKKPLITLSLVLNVLLILLVGFLMLSQFDVISTKDKKETEKVGDNGIEEDNQKSLINQQENQEETLGVQISVEDSDIEVLEWDTYTNKELGLTFQLPKESLVNEEEISLTAIQRLQDQEETKNCVFIENVEEDKKAQLAIGYDIPNTGPSECFRTSVGGGEVVTEEVKIGFGKNSVIQGTMLTYSGEENEQSYINYRFSIDQPGERIDEEETRYYGIQIEYPPEYEDLYLPIYIEILKSFEWL